MDKKTNNLLNLIEDCSPYYIRFTFNTIPDIIDICNDALEKDTFAHHKWLKLNTERVEKILSLIPFASDVNLNSDRALLFKEYPGGGSPIHKDAHDHKTSFNIGIKILDDKCITTWWSDEDMSEYAIDWKDIPGFKSRNLLKNNNPVMAPGINKKPIKQTVFKQGEFVLFNTDIYHTWDNSQSDNIRINLTMRSVEVSTLTFNDAKQLLSKYIQGEKDGN